MRSQTAELDEPTLVDISEAANSDDDKLAKSLGAEQAHAAEARRRMLEDAGIEPDSTYDDLQLPAAYWAKRSAIADTLVEFRTDGAIAMIGLAISTIASVWSLHL